MTTKLEEQKSEVRKRIEQALLNAGLGREFDKEIPLLALAIVRAQMKKERNGEI